MCVTFHRTARLASGSRGREKTATDWQLLMTSHENNQLSRNQSRAARTFTSAVAVAGPDASRVEDLVDAQVVEVHGEVELAAAAARVTGAASVSVSFFPPLFLQHQHGAEVTLPSPSKQHQ